MRRSERIAIIEGALLDAAQHARRRGVALIFGDAEVRDGGKVIGRRALAALEQVPRKRRGRLLPLSKDAEWDGIELGFDGVPFIRAIGQNDTRVPRDFWLLGKRLRRALRPVEADLLRAVHRVEEPTPAVRFT